MFQIYFCISIVIFSIALTTGLICGIYFKPREIYTDQEIYKFAGEVAICVSLVVTGIIILVMKKWKIQITKNLITEEKENEKE